MFPGQDVMAAYSFAVVDEALLCHGLFSQLRVAEGLAMAGVPAQLAAAYLCLDVPFAFDHGIDTVRTGDGNLGEYLGHVRNEFGPTVREISHEYRLSLVSGASNRCQPRPSRCSSPNASGSTAVWLTPSLRRGTARWVGFLELQAAC